MLWDASKIIGCTSVGSDGEGGTVTDLLFDDCSWRLRWMVVNTHHCFRREVLLPMGAVLQTAIVNHRLTVDLTVQEIADSLPAGLERPVSHDAAGPGDDPHLRSVDAVVGHRVHLTDGVIGHVEDLLVQDADWSIRFLRIDTCQWQPGGRVLLAPRLVSEIDWAGRLMRFDIGRSETAFERADRDVIWMKRGAAAGRRKEA